MAGDDRYVPHGGTPSRRVAPDGREAPALHELRQATQKHDPASEDACLLRRCSNCKSALESLGAVPTCCYMAIVCQPVLAAGTEMPWTEACSRNWFARVGSRFRGSEG